MDFFEDDEGYLFHIKLNHKINSQFNACLNHLFVSVDFCRNQKISARQKKHMLNYMRQHQTLGFGPSPGGEDLPDDSKRHLWSNLQKELDVIPGARYDAVGYSRVIMIF